MCGILAIYSNNKQLIINKEKFRDSIEIINHRGPDNIDVYYDNSTALGHARLSIIDLKKSSNQPLHSEDNRYSIVFNGEIFNYIEIRNDLEKKGVTFLTGSDTEVLLHAYIHWGKSCVKKFNGMWAFVIYDSLKNEFFCSRDRFGIKPLYYCKHKEHFIFASEIKSILNYFSELAIPNYNVIANYCRTSIGAQHSETWFKKIFRVEPANNVIVSNNQIEFQRYWDYPRKIDRNISFDDALKKYKDIFMDSVKIRLRSDVPVGITLSSGIDSTSIANSVNNINNKVNFNTYTAKFDNSNFSETEKQNYKNDVEIDEATIVKKFTSELNMSSNFIEVNYDNYVDNLSKLIWHLESGHGSPAIYPLDQVMKRATKDVTVVLEGQGADELLAGYINISAMVYIVELLKKFNFLKALREWKSLIKTYSFKIAIMLFVRQLNYKFINNFFFRMYGVDKLFTGPLKKYKQMNDYPKKQTNFDNTFNYHLYKNHTGGLVNLLHYGDAISMKYSLESRLPFMDYRLIELAFKLPPEFKIKNGVGKYIHRKAMKGILPDFILENKIKFGFDSPLSEILFNEGENSVKSVLFSDRCLNRGLFDKQTLKKMFLKSKTNKINTSRYLYRILCVEIWFREFID